MRAATDIQVWLAAGMRTPFARSDGPLANFDAIELSVIVVRNMLGQLRGALPDFAIWGAVVPNLGWSNIAREVLMDAGSPATITAFSTVMACSTSMIGAIEAAGMIKRTNRNLALVGGVDTLSRIPLGLSQPLSDWIVKFRQQRSLGQKLSHLVGLKPRDLRVYVPRIVNRTSGLSMGEHTEITAKEWAIAREDQDRLALESHQRAVEGWESGFFDDIVIPVGKLHEAFSAQVLFHIKAWESPDFLRDKAGAKASLGAFPRERMNPNGGSVQNLWPELRELPDGWHKDEVECYRYPGSGRRIQQRTKAPICRSPRLPGANASAKLHIDAPTALI